MTWETSDASKAVVDSEAGLVIADNDGVGQVTITAKSDAYGAEATYDITVTKKLTSNEDLALKGGEPVLNLTTNGENPYTVELDNPDADPTQLKWTASPEGVVSIEDGVITVLGDGTATITVETQDGTGLKNSFEVSVTTAVTNITINDVDANWTWFNATEALQLTAVVTPDDATDPSITWASSDTETATIDADGVVRVLKSGTVTFTATSVQNPDQSDDIVIEFEDKKITWSYSGDKAIITKYDDDDATEVTIPEYINGVPVKEIGDDAFQGKANLVTVYIPDAIEVIGARAFKNCSSLANMVATTPVA